MLEGSPATFIGRQPGITKHIKGNARKERTLKPTHESLPWATHPVRDVGEALVAAMAAGARARVRSMRDRCGQCVGDGLEALANTQKGEIRSGWTVELDPHWQAVRREPGRH